MILLRHREFLVLVPAATLVLSLGWTWSRVNHLPALESTRLVNVSAAYPLTPIEEPRSKSSSWATPSAQTKGAEWIFDLFTPPEIFYDAASRQFSVIPPRLAAIEAKPEGDDFGVALVEVRREPYRLQLVGFLGEGHEAVGAFENVRSTEHFLGRAGQKIPELGLTIEDFTLNRVTAAAGSGGQSGQLIAVAVLNDDETGEKIRLSSDERRQAGASVAVLLPMGSEATPVELHERESAEMGPANYRVEWIKTDPPSASISRISGDTKQKETRTLTVAESTEGSR